MLFSYKAKTKEGEVVEGTMEASDRFVVSRELKTKGNTPLSILSKNKEVNMGFLSSLIDDFFSGVGVTEQIVFTKNLSGMLKAGLSLSRGLSVIEKQTKKKKFSEILAALKKEIDYGGTLSSGLAKFPNIFSKLFVSMVNAGEESGNLSGALHEVGVNLEKSHALSKRVKGALIYPGVILSAMIIVGILMFAFIVPTLAKTFASLNVKLPVATQFIIAIGNFFSNYLILSFVFLIVIAIGGYFLFRAKFMAKYIDFVVLKTPIIGPLTKQLNTARTARTMASLLSSGISITHSLDITKEVVQNTYYKNVLEKAKEGIQKGLPFSEVFMENQYLYPVMMSEMVQVGEETGKLSEMLLEIASFYEEEIDNSTKNLSTVIEPVLMVFIGGAVGFFAISMISPLYSVMDNIK